MSIAGAWYRLGTVSVVNNNANVVGIGTKWVTSIIAIAVGDEFSVDNTTSYEVVAVSSDLSLVLDRPFEGVTQSNINYAIKRNTSGTTNTRLSGQVTKQFNQKQLLLDEWQGWTTSTNPTEIITDSLGVERSVLTISNFEIRAESAISGAEGATNSLLGLQSDVLILSTTVENIQFDLDTSEANAAASALLAKDWATKDTEVSAGKQSAKTYATMTAGDRLATNADVAITNADVAITGLDRIATGNDKSAVSNNATQTGLDRIATGNDKSATNANVVTTNSDATQTGLDRVATGQDRMATGNDVTTTNDNVAQTGADKNATLAAKNIALANANYKGEWATKPDGSPRTGPLSVPASVKEGSVVYMLNASIADVTLNQPSLNPDKWFVLGVIGSEAPDSKRLGGELPAFYAKQSQIDVTTSEQNSAITAAQATASSQAVAMAIVFG